MSNLRKSFLIISFIIFILNTATEEQVKVKKNKIIPRAVKTSPSIMKKKIAVAYHPSM
jgi:hypothetical protein